MKHTTFLPAALAVMSAALLAACGAGQANADATATTDAQAQDANTQSVVSATGEVIPRERAQLSFRTNGQIVELLVEPGDVVSEGDVLARLDTVILEADVASAEAGLKVAEAELERTRSGSRTQEIAEAESNYAAALANASAAAAQRDQLAQGATEAERLQAQIAVQEAFIAYIDQRAERDYVREVLDNIGDYDVFKQFLWREGLYEDKAEQTEFARLNMEVSQAVLDEVLNGPNPDDLRAAEAELWAASAEAAARQAELEEVVAGPVKEDIMVAEAQLQQAEAALESARTALAEATIVAPFDGVVALVESRVGEYVNSGQVIIQFGDLSTLRVETTDLNEIDVARIDVGDSATVTFDALPGVEVAATVLSVSPKSEEGTGVNYTVTVELDSVPEQVRWGMTAFVDIPTSR